MFLLGVLDNIIDPKSIEWHIEQAFGLVSIKTKYSDTIVVEQANPIWSHLK